MTSVPSSTADRNRAARRCLVIYNPVAGWRRRCRLDAALAALEAHGLSAAVVETTGLGHGDSLARAADADMVVAAGGDGTVGEVAGGLMARAEAGRPVPPLGIVPLGTANVMAAELGLPSGPVAAAGVVAGGRHADIHLGVANGRHFAIMAGVGFDAHVVRSVGPRLKRALGKGAYVALMAREWLGDRRRHYRVELDGEVLEAASVIVANGGHYAGRFVLAPTADLTAPVLQVCLFLRSGRWATLRYAAALAAGRLPRLGDYRVVPATHVTVTGPDGDPVQVDGDIAAELPLTVSVAPHRLRVIVPAA